MVWAWFRNVVENARKNKPFRVPSVLKFLSKEEFKLFTSVITKVEILRYLVSEWGCKFKEAEEYWNAFINSFDITYLNVKTVDFDDMISLVVEVPTKKKTLINLMHLQVAKCNRIYFLTGEEKLKKKYRHYYDKILTYKDLRKLFP
jgi:superfamily I DNA/RNA helicase